MFEVQTQHFQGPFDVLLQLIQKEQLDITQVSLAKIADDFILFIEKNELSSQELVDFLTIAVKLLYIKSKQIVPQLYEDELEEEQASSEELSKQLKRYKAFVDASKLIEKKLQEGMFSFAFEGKRPSVMALEHKFIPPEAFGINDLHAMYAQIVKGIQSFVIIPKATILKIKSLKEVMHDIHDKLAKVHKLSFFEVVDKEGNKTDMIVHFLGILELAKQRQVNVYQEKPFHDIMLKANES